MNRYLPLRSIVQVLSVVVVCILCAVRTVTAQSAEPFRPLVFLPGILGSELLDQDGGLVWGGLRSLKRFEELEITAHGPVKPLRVGGLIRNISILGPFWTLHQYDGLLKTLKDLNYREGETLFIFPYDWRYSNFETAQKLENFIDAQPALKDQQFDILAHSMGGIIARIYIQRLDGGPRVKRFISLGVPAQGAMNAFAIMSEGWGQFKNLMAGGIATIRRVVFSFPSLYELLPRYDNCCRIGDETTYAPFDPTDVNVWKANGWIPPEHGGPKLALVEKAFGDAQRLRELMRQPLPDSVEVTLIAGDRFGTYLYLYVDPNDRRWTKWRFSKNRGDGTVPLWSAANLNVGDSLPAFVDHATIFDDKWITIKLQRMLNKKSGPPPVSAPSIPLALSRTGNPVEVSLIDVSFEPPIVFSGEEAQFHLSISVVDEVQRDELSPAVWLDGPSGKMDLVLRNATTNADLERRVLKFFASPRLTDAGPHSVRINVPGVGTYTKDVLVLEQP
jgi:pimeloyl-ACP methyl ester carboxylesterase